MDPFRTEGRVVHLITHNEAEAKAALEAFRAILAEHAEHPWEQIGRCVYCGPCRKRLFQGTFDPSKHETFVRPKQKSPANQMRERWGMDER